MSKKNGYNRRDFLKIVGATTGAAAVGCGRDVPEKIIPYVQQPDESIPGVASWYAGSCGECSGGCGLLIRVREGRAVKIEGNPHHPINKGGVCAIGQSAIQSHYDPDRVREPLYREGKSGPFKPISWEKALGVISEEIAKVSGGNQSVLLTGEVSGSLSTLIPEFLKRTSNGRHVRYDLLGGQAVDQAAEASFGKGVRTQFDFSKARALVSVGADFLETWISPVEYARQWAEARGEKNGAAASHFVHVEPRLSMTAANADRWLKNTSGGEYAFLQALLASVVEQGGKSNAQIAKAIAGADVAALAKDAGVSAENISGIAKTLVEAPTSLVVAGGASVSADAVRCGVLANMLNVSLGNIGRSVTLQRVAAPAGSFDELEKLSGEMSDGKVGLLMLSGTNPAYTVPNAAEFKKALAQVGFVAAVSAHLDETTKLAHLVLPESTNFEAWSDAEPRPGLYNLNQPSMQPLYETQSLGDTLIAIAGKLDKPIGELSSFYDYIQAAWKKRTGAAGFDKRWLTYVEHGGDWSKQTAAKSGALASSATVALAGAKASSADGGLKLLAYPSVNSRDGSSANRPWMQELPNPITTAVWGTWVEMHPKRAKEIGVEKGDVVDLATEHGVISAPAYVTKYIDESLVAVPIGQGHEEYGRYASGVGANVLSILPAVASGGGQQFVSSVKSLRKSAFKDELVMNQDFDSQHRRGVIRSVEASKIPALESKAEKFLAKSSKGSTHAGEADDHHGEAHDEEHGEEHGGGHHDPHELGPRAAPKQMYEQMPHVLYKWGLSLDVNACTGCSACVVACYAENNIPVVGKELFAQGREMSWIRVERYLDGPDESPIEGFQPMMCQHCGNAPCEPVCPVYATYHSEDGLNAMVYNRCVGTRYCSNNCSYKVRRYNWFHYTWPTPLDWQLNPDVTVREVGVMEKCSMCMQRIREGRNTAKNLGRPVQDGDILPACASACPTKAISFGNRNDESSQIHANERNARSYQVLDFELNTQPAVTYLAKVRNPKGSVT